VTKLCPNTKIRAAAALRQSLPLLKQLAIPSCKQWFHAKTITTIKAKSTTRARPDKVRGLCRRPGCAARVSRKSPRGSGRARVVEFSYNATMRHLWHRLNEIAQKPGLLRVKMAALYRPTLACRLKRGFQPGV